jgi:hypothetical protein
MTPANYRRWRRILIWSSLLLLFMLSYPFIEEVMLQNKTLLDFFLDSTKADY